MSDAVPTTNPIDVSAMERLRAEGSTISVAPRRPLFSNAKNGKAAELNWMLNRIREDLHFEFIKVRGELHLVQDGRIEPVSKCPALFAAIRRRCGVHWKHGPRFMTKEEFYEALKMASDRFEAVETFPHEPRIPGVYYSAADLPESTGRRLEEFLERFQPATADDRVALKALALTLFWGGGNGNRPVFLLTNADPTHSGPSGRDTGRGIGKSSLVAAFADLCGGFIEMDQVEDLSKLTTRLLSPGADRKRLVRLDNVKSNKLSSAGLEKLITAPVISGHRMYLGEASMSNRFTFAITMNGAAVSEDLASRSFVIRLARPIPDPNWRRRLEALIANHRADIISDILECLRRPAVPLENLGRFADWEAAILGRIDGGQQALTAQRGRRASVDGDASEVQELCDCFRQTSEIGSSGITNDVMVRLVEDVTGNRLGTNKVWQYLQRIQVPGLQRIRTAHGVRYRWQDPDLPEFSTNSPA